MLYRLLVLFLHCILSVYFYHKNIFAKVKNRQLQTCNKLKLTTRKFIQTKQKARLKFTDKINYLQ